MAPSTKLAPGSRAPSTSALNHSSNTSILPPAPRPSLSGFNASHTQYASITPTLGGADKLRIWNVSDNRVVAEWDIAHAQGAAGVKMNVTGLTWVKLGGEDQDDSEDASRNKKRKKTKQAGKSSTATATKDVVVLAQGSDLLFYSSSLVKPVKKISVGDEKVHSITYEDEAGIIVTTTKEVIILDAISGESMAKFSLPANLPSSTAIATTLCTSNEEPENDENKLTIILSSLQVCILTVSLPLAKDSEHTFSVVQPAGAEAVRAVVPISTSEDDSTITFATIEENSRVCSIWQCTLDSATSTPTILASVPCPSASPVQSLSLTSDHVLFVLSTTGEAWGFDVSATSLASPAAQSSTPDSDKKSNKKRRSVVNNASLKPVITIESLGGNVIAIDQVATTSSPASDDDMQVDQAENENGNEIIVGRMVGPHRVKWDQVQYRDILGSLNTPITLKKPSNDFLTGKDQDNASSVPLQRYRDPAHSGSTTTALAREEEATLTREEMDLPVEGDLADMTLGERLAVLDPSSAPGGASANSTRQAGATEKLKEDDEPLQANLAPQTAQSLTRMLLQGLHTSDPQLLSLILTSTVNSTPALIRNTVRRLPASMALPLLKACVDRLGKGRAFGRRGGGRGGGLNERQGSCVVAWIRGVLVERGSVLMTVPSLPVHLASLSQLLSARLQLQAPLQSLSGRLDLAMAQIETRKEMVAAASNQKKAAEYIEGESDSEEDDDEDDDELDGDVEIEMGDDEGEIEDIGIESRSSRSRNADAGDSDGDLDLDDDEDAVATPKSKKGRKAVRTIIPDADDLSDDEE